MDERKELLAQIKMLEAQNAGNAQELATARPANDGDLDPLAPHATLRASEARAAAVLAAARDCIITIDQMGAVVEWNPAAEQTFGYRRGEVLGHELAELIIPPELRERHRKALARYFMTGESNLLGHPVELTGMRADGSRFPVELTVVRVPYDGPPLFTGYLRDISASKRTEQSLRFLDHAARLLGTSLDYETTVTRVVRLAVPFLADCCVVMLAADFPFRRSAVAHVDRAKEDTLRMLQERFPLDPNRLENLRTVFQTGQPKLIPEITEEMMQAVAPHPEHRSILDRLNFTSAMVLPLAAHGRTFGTLIFTTTGSRRRYEAGDLGLAQDLAAHVAFALDNARLYAELQQALAARDEFLSLAAHELKSPLAGIVGYLRMLEQRHAPVQAIPQLDPQLPQVMAAQADRLNRLVDTLIDLTRIQSGQSRLKTQPVDLVVLMRRVVERLVPASNHHVVCRHPEVPVMVDGDELHLEQVLDNLIQNAIKYSPSGGEVTVSAACEGNEAVLTVRDEGIGIPDAEQARLFQRFYRAANIGADASSGLGIGLYLAQELVTRHGGRIEVTSTEGRGSSFMIRLPLVDGPEDMSDEGLAGSPP